jgi:hypothetical protein
MGANYGHRVLNRLNLTGVYALTDPDLLFAPDMPTNVLQHLYGITLSHNARRAGLALDLSDSHGFKTFDKGYMVPGKSIYEWEKQFWSRRVPDETYELYDAPLDTTFHVVNTDMDDSNTKCFRVAGPFTCKHLPWYKDSKVAIPKAELLYYKKTQTCSSTESAEDRDGPARSENLIRTSLHETLRPFQPALLAEVYPAMPQRPMHLMYYNPRTTRTPLVYPYF